MTTGGRQSHRTQTNEAPPTVCPHGYMWSNFKHTHHGRPAIEEASACEVGLLRSGLLTSHLQESGGLSLTAPAGCVKLSLTRDLWAQTSSCEMSHPSVLSITVNTNDSLFAICDTPLSTVLRSLPEVSVLTDDRFEQSLVLSCNSGIYLHGEQTQMSWNNGRTCSIRIRTREILYVNTSDFPKALAGILWNSNLFLKYLFTCCWRPLSNMHRFSQYLSVIIPARAQGIRCGCKSMFGLLYFGIVHRDLLILNTSFLSLIAPVKWNHEELE